MVKAGRGSDQEPFAPLASLQKSASLKGNPGKRALNKDEPKPAPRLRRVPRHLSDEARKEWRRAGRFLLKLGLASDLELAAFAAYCTGDDEP